MQRTGFVLGVLYIISFLSCDILRSSPFEIAGWSPGEGYRDVNGGVIISLQFSHEPDRGSVERSFEFSEDGVKLNGQAAWQGDTLVFSPVSPPRYGHDYAVVVNTDAQDTEGISLEKRFEGRWTTHPTESRPQIVSTFPEEGDVIAPGYTRLAVEFSTMVTLNACNNHISFSPQVKGSWALDASRKQAVWTPDAAWRPGTDYKMTIDAAFESFAGKTLGAERVVHFTAEGETVPPEITEVTALDENGEAVQRDGVDYVLAEVYAENAGWESGYKLLFRFSEEVDVSSFKKAVSVEPALPFAIETRTAVADAVILSFTERPVFGWRYVIRVDIGIKDKLGNESLHPKAYRIYVDGKKSKLPVFKKLEIASNGVSAAYEADDNFKPLEQTSDDEAVVTLWFETAEGADVQLYSVMECFSVSSTNNAVSFTPLSIAYGTAESGESRPVVITGALNVKAIESGVITFSVGSGLLDSYGNKQPDAWKLVLLK